MSTQISLKEFIIEARQGDITTNVHMLDSGWSSFPQRLKYSKENNELDVYYVINSEDIGESLVSSDIISKTLIHTIHQELSPHLKSIQHTFSTESLMDILEVSKPDFIYHDLMLTVFLKMWDTTEPYTQRQIAFLTSERTIREAFRHTTTEPRVTALYTRLSKYVNIPKPSKLLILKHG